MRRGKKRKAAGAEPAAAVVPELPRELWSKITTYAVGDMHANCVSTLRLVNKQWAWEFRHLQLRFAIKKIFADRQKERHEAVERKNAALGTTASDEREMYANIHLAAGLDRGDMRMLLLIWNTCTVLTRNNAVDIMVWRTSPLRMLLEALRATV